MDVTEIDGYEGLEKVRINVENISDITIVNEQTFVKFKDEINKADPEGLSTKDETEEEAINRIQSRFEILNEMTEAVATKKVRAMIVSGPPGIGKSYGVETTLEKFSTFDDIAGSKRKFEVVKGAMSAVGLYKKLYEHADAGHVICFDDCDAIL